MSTTTTHPTATSKVIARIDAAMTAAGVDEALLAERTGIDQTDLMNILSLRAEFGVEELIRITLALGVEFDEILPVEDHLDVLGIADEGPSSTECPAWCSPTECDYSLERGDGVHNGERLSITPTGPGWDIDAPIEVYPTWAPEDDREPAGPGVYLYVHGEGVLTPAEARELAAQLVEAAEAIEEAGR